MEKENPIIIDQIYSKITNNLRQMSAIRLDLVTEESQKIDRQIMRRVQGIRRLVSLYKIKLPVSFCANLFGQINSLYHSRNISATGIEVLSHFLIDCVIQQSSAVEAGHILYRCVHQYGKNNTLHNELYNYVLGSLMDRAQKRKHVITNQLPHTCLCFASQTQNTNEH